MKYLWLGIFAAVFIWPGIFPKDRFTWFLEVVPAIVGVIVLAITYRSFRFTPLVYFLLLVHCVILMDGGHYTYAEVPLFDYFKTLFGFTRNNYDKVDHFAQGFVPAMIARELLIRPRIGGQYTNIFLTITFSYSSFTPCRWHRRYSGESRSPDAEG